MKYTCVLEFPEHFEVLRQGRSFSGDTRWFAASHEAEEILRKNNLPFTSLTDESISTEWNAINTWARKVSLEWFSDPAFEDVLKIDNINLGNALSRPISHALIYQLKSRLIIEKLLSLGDLEAVLIFEDYEKGRRVDNSLNSLLSCYLKETQTKLTSVRVQLNSKNIPSPKEALRCLVTFCLSCIPSKSHKFQCVGMGAINHIFPVLSRRKKSRETVFIDEKLQLDTLSRCKKAGVQYSLMDSFMSFRERIKLWSAYRTTVNNLKIRLNQVDESQFFTYQNKPVPGIKDAILRVVRKKAWPRLKPAFVAKKIFSQENSKALILHEDFNELRAAALAVNSLNKSVVVLSHGIPPTNCDWSNLRQKLGVADVIVNSNFERDKYIQTGYLPEKIHVLGLPRYDLIYDCLKNSYQGAPLEEAVLYCPHMLRELSKHQRGYLGVHTPGALTKQYAISVMKACEKLNLKLWIKLHDDQDVGIWKRLVKEYGDHQVTLFLHNENIFNLVKRSRLVVTTFSTVVIEALLLDRDVISMNFTGSPDVHPFNDYGISLRAHNSAELEEALRNILYDDETQRKLRRNRKECAEYFGGEFDGYNAERVSKYIQDMAQGLQSDDIPSVQTRHAEEVVTV